MRKIVFVDMDGVVARYERWAYRGRIMDDVREKEPIFAQKGSKFFRTCKPDLDAISMVKGLNSINSLSVMILSGVSSGEVGVDQIEDKSYWLKRNMYFLNETQQLFTSGSKVAEACNFLGIRELNKDLILIDDFNGNLLEWEKAGEVAIKYINGVNSESSWNGLKVRSDSVVEDISSIMDTLGIVR